MARSTDRGGGNTLLNAGLGAVVTVIFSFTVFSPILGGAVASYLQDDDSATGVRVGALSGVFAALPFLLLALFVGSFVFAGPMMGGGPMGGLPGGFGFLFVFGIVLALAWTVGLGAVGGYLGVYVRRETDIGS